MDGPEQHGLSPRYRLTFRPVGPSPVPPALRLKRLLKLALRSLGLRCERLEVLPRDDADSEPDPAA